MSAWLPEETVDFLKLNASCLSSLFCTVASELNRSGLFQVHTRVAKSFAHLALREPGWNLTWKRGWSGVEIHKSLDARGLRRSEAYPQGDTASFDE